MSSMRTTGVALLAVALVAPPDTTRQDDAPLAIVGARVYADPSAAPIDDAIVLTSGARITAVGPRKQVPVPDGATRIDGSGLVVLAGFQNSHVHFTDDSRWGGAASRPAAALEASLREMVTRYGFTTVVDLASDFQNTIALRRRIDSGGLVGPRILTAGGALYPPDGVPYYVRDTVSAAVLQTLPTPATAEAARTIVRAQLDGGADAVKLFVGSWVSRGRVLPMPDDIAAAAVAVAGERRRPAFAHPSNLAGLEVALRSGVNVLAHAVEDTTGMTNAHYARMVEQRMAMVPTLHLFDGRGQWEIQDEVRQFARRGGQILFGTDVGYLPDFDHAIEYERMASAGLSWREILASLTTAPAERFAESSQRGRVAIGLAADLVAIGTDPSVSARSFGDVRLVVRAGRVIYRR
jgi:imidazolonepropionase-like amidohydrolase